MNRASQPKAHRSRFFLGVLKAGTKRRGPSLV
jgi:hypothetical protein